MAAIAAGTVLGGKYRLEAQIGQGGMGSVWRAEHLGLRASVAVKLLNVEFDGRSDALARFHREAHAAAAIRSPHVVQILDHGVDEATRAPFIVMELLEGQSLAARLSRSGRIEAAEVARIFTHVARALTRAHEAGIVHRDLKPDNVFLVRNEDEEVAKVLDFGIAKAHGVGTDSATRTGAVMGTAYYMSPEQISGLKDLDFRTDLWALGVMACECLTGRRPFDADSIGGLTLKICIEPIPKPSSFAEVPVGFDAWFERITHRTPARRFSSAREAAEALRQVVDRSAAKNAAETRTLLSGDVARGAPTATHAPLSTMTHSPLAATTRGPLSRSAPPSPAASSSRTLPLLSFGALIAVSAGWFWLRRASTPPSQPSAGGGSSVTTIAVAQPVAPSPLISASEGTASTAPPPASTSPITRPTATASSPPPVDSVGLRQLAALPSAAGTSPANAAVRNEHPASGSPRAPATRPPAPSPTPSTPKLAPELRDVIDERR